jgi:hypothetical protein
LRITGKKGIEQRHRAEGIEQRAERIGQRKKTEEENLKSTI